MISKGIPLISKGMPWIFERITVISEGLPSEIQGITEISKGITLISEIKKASPSAGVLVKNFNHLDIAKIYVDNGATCLSVLTEEKHFLGKLDYIQDIKKQFKIMNKQFICVMDFWGDYYPIILAFFSFLYSVSLWFSGQKLEGIFVGIWVPSILGFSVAIRQRRRDRNKRLSK